jgi:hypothetical protein
MASTRWGCEISAVIITVAQVGLTSACAHSWHDRMGAGQVEARQHDEMRNGQVEWRGGTVANAVDNESRRASPT